MGLAVVSTVSGGLPVVESTAGGTPVTEATNGYGMPVTKVPGKPGMPVVFDTIGVGPGLPSPPTGVTGLLGWWDASVTASLNLTGSNINSVADQSGGGRTMNWYLAKPQYNATGFNSTKPAMVFAAASTNVLRTLLFPMGGGNTATFWYVGTVGAAGNATRVFAYAGVGNDFNSAGGWAWMTATGPLSVFYRNTVSVSSAVTAHPAPHRFIVTVKSDGLITLYVDGVSSAPLTKSENWTGAGELRIGAQSPSDQNYWTGPVAECGVATGYSDAAAVAQLDTYLKTKWGL